MTNLPISDPSEGDRGARGDRKLSKPLLPLDQVSHRISAAVLGEKGIKNVRVLNESRFLSVVEGMVEERVKAHIEKGPIFSLPVPPADEETPSASILSALTAQMLKQGREQSRGQYRELLQRFEEKLRRLEERAALLAANPLSPSQ